MERLSLAEVRILGCACLQSQELPGIQWLDLTSEGEEGDTHVAPADCALPQGPDTGLPYQRLPSQAMGLGPPRSSSLRKGVTPPKCIPRMPVSPAGVLLGPGP